MILSKFSARNLKKQGYQMTFGSGITSIHGAHLFKRPFFRDRRGSFSTLYQSDWAAEAQLQFNISRSFEGVFRGMHYSEGHPEGKYVSVASGSIIDFVFDIRPDSPSYGVICAVELFDNDNVGVFVPPGCAHGFLALETSLVAYATTKLWKQDEERGLSFESPICRNLIEMKLRGLPKKLCFSDLILSDKDRVLPLFDIGLESKRAG